MIIENKLNQLYSIYMIIENKICTEKYAHLSSQTRIINKKNTKL